MTLYYFPKTVAFVLSVLLLGLGIHCRCVFADCESDLSDALDEGIAAFNAAEAPANTRKAQCIINAFNLWNAETAACSGDPDCEIAASTLYGVRVGNCDATYAYEMIGPLATWAGAALIAVNAYIECLNQ